MLFHSTPILRLDNQVNGVFAGHTALQAACQNGHSHIAKVLLSAGADIELEDDDGDRAVHHAAFGNASAVMEILATAGADLNARNKRRQTGLHISVNKGHVDSVRSLLQHGCHSSLQDSEGDTPLHDAISKNRDDMTSLLLKHGADISLSNNAGFNCVQHASLRGNLSSLQLMLLNISRPWIVDEKKDDGYTALHLACLNNHIKVVKCLVEFGKANPDLLNVNQQSALHLAVERRHEDIVETLVTAGANVNITDKDGDSPLHECLRHLTLSQLRSDSRQQLVDARNLSLSIATCLVRQGASLNIRNKKGQTPLDLCHDPMITSSLQSLSNPNVDNNEPQVNEKSHCLVCAERKANTVFSPCGHSNTCHVCSDIMTKCLTCRVPIENRTQLSECLICSEELANVQFQPCRHVVTCDMCAPIVKKCLQCRQHVEGKVSLQNSLLNDSKKYVSGKDCLVKENHEVDDVDRVNVNRLKQQLEDMKEKDEHEMKSVSVRSKKSATRTLH